MNHPKQPPIWVVRVADVAKAELAVAHTFTEEERAALAAYADILGISFLEAKVKIVPWASGVEARIDFRAKLTQACVVTLEPVEAELKEHFIRRYLPGLPAYDLDSRVIELAPDEEDPPEPLVGDSIDVGAVVAEQFILSLDPYPRLPGAALPDEAKEQSKESSPFAVLERLKGRT